MICETLFGRERAATIQTLGHPAAGVIGWVPSENYAGVTVTQDTALGFSAVWAATNKIAGMFGSLPCKVFQDEGNARREAREHPVYRIVHDEPNPDMDSYTFWEMMSERWVNWGTALAEIERTQGGEIVALHPIHPTRAGIWTLPNGSWEWHVQGDRGRVAIQPRDMFVIVGALSKDGRCGRGVIDMACESIGIGLASERFQGSFFGNGARPSGVLEHPGTLKDEARKNIRREWNELYQGPKNAGKIGILWEGMKYTAVGVEPEQAQMIETAQFRITDMARWYDLPPHVIGDLTRSTFSNIDSQQISLVVDSYRPRIIRVERAMRRQLFSEEEKAQGYYVRFILDALLRGDPKARAETNNIKFNSGVITVNEWRAQDELDPIGPDGDKRFIQLNMTTLDKAGEDQLPADTVTTQDQNQTVVDEAAIQQATRATLDDVLCLMTRKESEAAERAAAEPLQFVQRIDKFYETHAARMEAALDKPLVAWLLASGQKPEPGVLDMTVMAHIASHKADLLEASECQPEELKSRVLAVIQNWEREPK